MKIVKVLTLCLLLISTLVLGGCMTKDEEPVNTLTVEACMKDANIPKSVQGDKLTYYYKGADELNLYHVSNWGNGVVTLRKYFVNQEKYEVQKGIYKNSVPNDKKMMIYVEQYDVVSDMDAFWSEIENSSTYIMVK